MTAGQLGIIAEPPNNSSSAVMLSWLCAMAGSPATCADTRVACPLPGNPTPIQRAFLEKYCAENSVEMPPEMQSKNNTVQKVFGSEACPAHQRLSRLSLTIPCTTILTPGRCTTSLAMPGLVSLPAPCSETMLSSTQSRSERILTLALNLT